MMTSILIIKATPESPANAGQGGRSGGAFLPLFRFAVVGRLIFGPSGQTVEVVHGALRMGGGLKDRPLVLFQHPEP